MSLPSASKLREDLRQISRVISAPNSLPDQQMRAKRENNSSDWQPDEDARRCDANLDDYLDRFEEAAELLGSKPRP